VDRLRQWLAISLVALLAILAGGWFLLIAPERSEAAELRAQAEAEQLTNEQLETQLEVLRARAVQLPAKRAELVEVAEKVPAGPSLPELVRALTAAARDAGVALTSVTPGAPAALAAPVPAAPVAPVEGAAAVPGPAASGLSEVPVVLEAEGDFYELEQFLAELEDLPRALRVTALVVQAGEDSGTASSERLRATVTASAYMRAASAPPPAVPAAPVVQGATDAAPPVPATGGAAASAAPAS
jgi:Tfp pilus assembly protein PilO